MGSEMCIRDRFYILSNFRLEKMDKNSYNKSGNKAFSFQFKREGYESNLSPFQRTVGSTENTLPKFHTDESEKKYLQSASASVEDDDLYDPLNPTEEIEPVKEEPPKKKKKKRSYVKYSV